MNTAHRLEPTALSPAPDAGRGCDSPPSRRVMVVGTSGCGKSHVAAALAERLGVPYISNDAIIWGPDWTPTPRLLRYDRFDAATRGPAWTFDGNVGSLDDPEDHLILARADTLVWLDLPRRSVWWQVIRRTISRCLLRRELWHGNRETLRGAFFSRDSIIWWSIRTFSKRRRQYAAIFADPQFVHLTKIRLTSRRQVNRWLKMAAPVGAAERVE